MTLLGLLIGICVSAFSREEPIHISDEGVYFYRTQRPERKEVEIRGHRAVEGRDGAYYYDMDGIDDDKDLSKMVGEPRSFSKGVVQYERIESEQNKAVLVQFSSLELNDFTAGESNLRDVYNSSLKGVFVDFEWHKRTTLAKFGFVFGSGIFTGSASGRFANPTLNPGISPQEKYSLFLVPLNAKLRMNFEYYHKQYVVPFIEAGAGITGIWERRDDGEKSVRAYTPTLMAGGGFSFLLNWMGERSIARLDSAMGVNNIWLTTSYHIYNATNSKYDVSSSQLQIGIKVDY